MRVTLPAPVTYLPESLFALLEQPGRELTVRVVEVEGKTLTLETGGERFQARLAGSLLPEDFRLGENVRVRVLSPGPPVLLQLVEGPGVRRAEERFARLVQVLQPQVAALASKLPAVSEKPDPLSLVAFLVRIMDREVREKEKFSAEIEDRKIFQESGRDWTILSRFWQEGHLVLPFFFADRLSWGFMEAGREEGTSDSERFFYLRLFLSELGLMEVFIRAVAEKSLKINFYFSREEALALAREGVLELRRELAERGFWPEITLEKSYYEPGVILVKEG